MPPVHHRVLRSGALGMLGEDSQRERLVRLALLVRQRRQRFESRECLGAQPVVLVGDGSESEDGISLDRVEQIVILGQRLCRRQRRRVLPRIQLPLCQHEKVKRLRPAPRPIDHARLLVRGPVLGQEPVERRARRVGARGPGLQPVLLHLQRAQDVELLGAHGVGPVPGGERVEETCRLEMLLGLGVQLNRLHCLSLGQQMRCVLGKHGFHVGHVVLPGEIHRQVPLVEAHARVDGILVASTAVVRFHGLLAQSHRCKHGRYLVEQRVVAVQLVDHRLEVSVVLCPVVALGQTLLVAAAGVVCCRLLPLEAVGVVVSNAIPRLCHHFHVWRRPARVKQLDHAEPVAKLDTHLLRQITAVHLMVDAFGDVEFVEKNRNLGVLLPLIVQSPEFVDKFNPAVVLTPHKSALGNVQVQLLQRKLCKQSPQARVGIVLDEGCHVIDFDLGSQQSARVTERLAFDVDDAPFCWMFRITIHYV
eukprot:m.1481073 g.1481073  ORF g.1481073 m.1481073 type:complete len:476 (+) comp25173_c2_seq4:3286-4713(+)